MILILFNKKKKRMPDIEIITWNEICEKISYDDDDRLKRIKL